MKYWIIFLIIVVLAGVVWALFFSGKFMKKALAPTVNNSANNSTAPQTTATPKPAQVVLETNLGNIQIQLQSEAAPQTAANFEKLVNKNFYNNLTFHRIVPGFVIQGGDPKGDGTGGPGYTVPSEIKLPHKRGAVAMARLPDAVNPHRDSSGSQFYIALQDLPQLDGQYTVFGEVVVGMDIVDKIAAVPTDAAAKPLQPVIIKKAYLLP